MSSGPKKNIKTLTYRLETCTDAFTFSIQPSHYHRIRMSRGVSMRSGVRPIVCASWPTMFMGDAREEHQQIKQINDVSSWNLHRNVYVFNSILKLTSRSYVEWARKKNIKNIEVSTWHLHRRMYVFNSVLSLPPHSYVARCVYAFRRSSDRLRKLTTHFHGGCARRTSKNKKSMMCRVETCTETYTLSTQSSN